MSPCQLSTFTFHFEARYWRPADSLLFSAASFGASQSPQHIAYKKGTHITYMTVRLIFAVLCTVLRLGTALSIPSAPAKAPPNIICIGGSSGMGKAAAVAAVRRGGKALIVSRSEDKLEKAAQEIVEKAGKDNDDDRSCVTTAVLDATDEAAVERFASELNSGDWDGLVVSTAGRAPHGPVSTLPTESTRDLFESKFWTAYHCAKHIAPRLRPGGAIAFVAGVLNRRPGMNCAPLATTNGALEGLTRALALEMGPSLRVNCLSPGFCDTERFDHMDPERKVAMLANTADR